MTRFRRRKQIPNTLRVYWGVAEYSNKPEIVYNWGVGCGNSDVFLLHQAFSSDAEFVKELIKHGYDITTLEFRISKKEGAK